MLSLFLTFLAFSKEIIINNPKKDFLIFIKNNQNQSLNYTISREDIKVAVFNMMLENIHNKNPRKGKLQKLIKDLINNEKEKAVFYLEAKKLGYENLPIVKAKLYKFKDFNYVMLLKQDVTSNITISEKEMKKFYYKHYNRVNVSRIRNPSFKEIYLAYKALLNGTPFEKVAQLYSKDVYKDQGGKVGWVLKERLPKEILEVINKTPEGNFSKPFFYNDAWYIVKVNKNIIPNEKEFQKYKSEIESFLKKEKEKLVEEKALSQYRKKYKIKIYYDVLNQITLKKYPKRAIVALVGDIPIFSYQVYNLMKNTVMGMEAKSQRFHKKLNINEVELRTKALDVLIKQALVSCEAWNRHYEKKYPWLKKRIEGYKKDILADIYIKTHILPKINLTEKDIKLYYEKHKNEFKKPDKYLLAIIVSSNCTKIKEAYNLLKSGANFYYVASIYNDSPILKDKEGKLDWLSETKLGKKEIEVLKKLEIGQFSPIIKKKHVCEIILLRDKRKGGYYPLKLVRNEIIRKLYQKKYKEALENSYKKLLNNYTVYINQYQIEKLISDLTKEKK